MKYLFLMLFSLSMSIGHCQKSKKVAKKSPAGNKTVLAKLDDLTVETARKKDEVRFYILFGDSKKKDTLQLKLIDISENGKDALSKNNNIPTDCTITPVNVKDAKLYAIAWTEKSYTAVPDKIEDATKTITEIWNVPERNQAFANIQTSTHITEILYLDKLKGASQTSEKKRGEGFALTILPNGDVIQVGKNQQNKFSYNPSNGKYAGEKLPVSQGKPATKPAPRKR